MFSRVRSVGLVSFTVFVGERLFFLWDFGLVRLLVLDSLVR